MCSSVMSSPRAAKESPALRDVILSQKEKIDKLEENEKFLKFELAARESYINKLQTDLAQALEEKQQISNNFNAIRNPSFNSESLADPFTKI
jgi:hypothetical protein